MRHSRKTRGIAPFGKVDEIIKSTHPHHSGERQIGVRGRPRTLAHLAGLKRLDSIWVLSCIGCGAGMTEKDFFDFLRVHQGWIIIIY